MARALITMPKTARKGEIIDIRALIAHPMETGYRPGADGRILPRNIIVHFSCRYGDIEVFSADLYPAIAANPYIAFHTVATESAVLSFRWEGDNGFDQTERMELTVNG
ncbi:thiosulfate oxidation carrier complex protein SoxZ [Noviherbaspirillum galbum]|uniref:Thiosulfate oxidation carrier complex protein SoxZ n=1 Tax=Noviherbaspirillum galbum TaxID=2709383 RepID=A0A6B3SQQ5_9BURK|nr:thiosulfate oxidation carrier complex protein SoxZ [Noviherbaspirillum galbum]NEX63097.1 thiosulfate oxidation carrier complex protein SoxZ [Noviherbaspirillum galbum]